MNTLAPCRIVCRVCGDTFDGLPSHRRCPACSVLTCQGCGVQFRPIGGRYTQKFCSRSCGNTHTPKKKGKKYPHTQRARVGSCLTCGAEYRATGDHGERRQRYCSHDCYMRSRAETTIEAAVRMVLDALGVEYVAQHRIGRYFVDFFIPAERLVIEADGDYWHAQPRVAAKDRRKDAALTAAGYRVLHLSESTIREGSDVIRRRYADLVGKPELAP